MTTDRREETVFQEPDQSGRERSQQNAIIQKLRTQNKAPSNCKLITHSKSLKSLLQTIDRINVTPTKLNIKLKTVRICTYTG